MKVFDILGEILFDRIQRHGPFIRRDSEGKIVVVRCHTAKKETTPQPPSLHYQIYPAGTYKMLLIANTWNLDA